ncbi:unnamed protein product [Caenorhabditis sp. 36 PRJEB53466]|nr:unnamed protein product [Caenorhabditis sp. 36 PRJEB53466]
MRSKNKRTEPSVEVFVRPLEVTVPADFLYQKPEESKPQKTYWSTMTSNIHTETSIKRWSIPPVTIEEGKPPGPEERPSTKEGREQAGNVLGVHPNYKTGTGQPKQEIPLSRVGALPNGTGDYKVTSLQETYKQTLIDPKVLFKKI